jgi:SOS-response transcriptional repressor LexA
MKWHDFAKGLMADKKIKQDDLIGVLGVKTRGAVGHYLSGRRVPSAEQLIALANKLDITFDELMNCTIEKSENQSYTDFIAAPEVKGKVPLYSLAQVGDWSEADIKLLPTDGYEMVETRIEVKERTFAVKVAGDSMETEFSSNGDIVIVEPDMPYQHDDYVLAKKGGDVFIRQICNEGGDWLLKPLNKRYEIKPLGEYCIIGVVRGKQKSYR